MPKIPPSFDDALEETAAFLGEIAGEVLNEETVLDGLANPELDEEW